MRFPAQLIPAAIGLVLFGCAFQLHGSVLPVACAYGALGCFTATAVLLQRFPPARPYAGRHRR